MKLKTKIAGVLAAILCMSNVGTMAAENTEQAEIRYYRSDIEINPRFAVLIDCWNGLKDEGGGKLKCTGGTLVRDGYNAGTTMELQKYSNGSWSTIKTWAGTGGSEKSYGESYYVASGTYQIKVTHTAISNGNMVETFISYSKSITC